MKSLKILFITSILLVSMTACTSRDNSSSSSSSSMEPSMPPPTTSSSEMSEPSSSSSESSSAPAMSTDFSQIGTLEKEKVLWGPGTHKDDRNRPTDIIPLQEKYGKYNAHFIAPPDNNKVYLTFDEGYENGFTPAILDALKEKNASAVFFVTMPFAKQNPELIRRMIDEGHVVGNHSNKHFNYPDAPVEKAYEDALSLHEYIQTEFDYTMNLFRFPEGAFNEQTAALLQSMNYKTIFWSFAYADWDPKSQMGYDAAYKKVTDNIHPGAIMLLHAVSKDNAEILPAVIDEIRSRGLEISKYDVDYLK